MTHSKEARRLTVGEMAIKLKISQEEAFRLAKVFATGVWSGDRDRFTSEELELIKQELKRLAINRAAEIRGLSSRLRCSENELIAVIDELWPDKCPSIGAIEKEYIEGVKERLDWNRRLRSTAKAVFKNTKCGVKKEEAMRSLQVAGTSRVISVSKVAEYFKCTEEDVLDVLRSSYTDKIVSSKRVFLNEVDLNIVKKGLDGSLFQRKNYVDVKTMTVQEVAQAFQCSEDTVLRAAKALWPEKVKNGLPTRLNEAEVTDIKLKIEKNSNLRTNAELPKTELEQLRLIEQAIVCLKGMVDKAEQVSAGLLLSLANKSDDQISATNTSEDLVLEAVKREEAEAERDALSKKLEALQVEKEELSKKVEVLEPKAKVYDDYLKASGFMSSTEAAQLLGVGRNTLFDFMRERKLLTSQGLPYQTLINRGFFRILTVEKPGGLFPAVFVSFSGVEYMRKLSGDSGILK